ncbi:MAG: hypothetical protein A2X48_04505 [Lentisphaerae bacterium GWF2_49_21]|nr:MAG: hypothetical protein A2X48_04505 [Lentisphaerae bacterium GWF2_49_21]
MNAKESQNQVQFDNYKINPTLLGPYTTHIYNNDPKHLVFLLSRYKFVAKMLEGKNKVLDIGVGDGFGLPIVSQTVNHILAIDWEPLLIDNNRKRLSHVNCEFKYVDITENIPCDNYDAAYSLDVIEHIPLLKNDLYFKNIASCLSSNGVFVVGTPNIAAFQYASEESKAGHVNLKSHKSLRSDLEKYYYNVFMFSMNDEIVHTGFAPMSHYIFGMGVGKR